MHFPFNKSRAHPWTRRRVELGEATLRILIVDDNQNAAEALAAYLSFERWNVKRRSAASRPFQWVLPGTRT